jgi:hypothetical protein
MKSFIQTAEFVSFIIGVLMTIISLSLEVAGITTVLTGATLSYLVVLMVYFMVTTMFRDFLRWMHD